MAQTFNNGDSNLSVRTKLNDNATELNSTTSALAGKATPADIETALDEATIFFDDDTFEGAVYPVPGPGQPAVGTEDNPIKAKNAGGGTVVDSVIDGNMNAVTSNAVYDAIQTLLGGYTGTLQDLYNLIASGLITPAAPTSFIVDDVANTGDWTNVSGHADISDYEYQINGGTITTATVKPFIVGNIDAAIGDVKIRVKAVTGVSNASAWLTNPSAYTYNPAAGNYMPGFTAFDPDPELLGLEEILDGIWKPINTSGGADGQKAGFSAGFYFAIKIVAEDDCSANMGINGEGIGFNYGGFGAWWDVDHGKVMQTTGGGGWVELPGGGVVAENDFVIGYIFNDEGNIGLKLYKSSDGITFTEMELEEPTDGFPDISWYLIMGCQGSARIYYPQYKIV